jgi:soluble lytic murein transglycosylase
VTTITPRSRLLDRIAQRSASHDAKQHDGSALDPNGSALKGEQSKATHRVAVPLPRARPAAASLPLDLVAVKQAIDLVRQRKQGEAIDVQRSVEDPVALKLIEWVLLRHPDSQAGFERYATFIRTNPDWPSIPLLRRRAEARLWQEGRGAGTARRFLGQEQPTSAAGRLALARVLLVFRSHQRIPKSA